MNTLYIYFLIFFCVAYLIVTDASVARAFTLVYELVKFQYQKSKWMILNDPRNPIVRYFMWKRAYKMAKEIQDELKSNAK